MKKINLPGFSFNSKQGELATFLTIIIVAIMLAGIIIGNKINNGGTRTNSHALEISIQGR